MSVGRVPPHDVHQHARLRKDSAIECGRDGFAWAVTLFLETRPSGFAKGPPFCVVPEDDDPFGPQPLGCNHHAQAHGAVSHDRRGGAKLGSEPSGALRLNVSHEADSVLGGSFLGDSLNAYPRVRLGLVVTRHTGEILEAGYHAAVGLGEMIAQDMLAVPFSGKMRLTVVGSPSYFERHALRGGSGIPDRRGHLSRSVVRNALATTVLVSAFATRGLSADVLNAVLADHQLVLGEAVLCSSGTGAAQGGSKENPTTRWKPTADILAIVTDMPRNVYVAPYILVMIAVVVIVDVMFLRDRLWGRLIVNIGIVLLFAAFYFIILKKP